MPPPISSRRRFLAASSALTAPIFIPSSAFGSNDKVNLGVIGIGKQGEYHTRYLGRMVEDARVVAVCDCFKEYREIGVMFADSDYGSKVCTGYADYRELLERPDIDAVLIALPDHWHAVVAIEAARAGKDIYCEKPLSLTVAEARAMVAATRRYDRVFQTGSQQRSEGGFRYACELVRSGFIGELKTIHADVGGPSVECDLPAEPPPPGLDWDRWIGPAPWRPYHAVLRPPHNMSFPAWRNYRDFSGGGMTDWGAHHFDIAQWGMGMDGSGPVEVVPPDGKTIKTLEYHYASGVTLFRGEAYGVKPDGVRFTGTKGWIEVNRGKLASHPESLIQQPIPADGVHLYKSPGHHRDWLDCIRERRRPICDVEIGASTATLCHIGNIAQWLGRPLRWDPQGCAFDHDEQANRMLDRARREPWTL